MSGSAQELHERREKLYAELVQESGKRYPKSGAFHDQASVRLVDGVSQALRRFDPFPFWVKSARGAYVYDLDGNAILDFWQGHFANILGHNPPQITERLSEALREDFGLQCGVQDTREAELADIYCRQVGAEKVRFTTSGSLATMYALMLCRAYTGRSLILKVGGGWHGAQPWALKGVSYGREGYQAVETEGLPGSIPEEVLVIRYNDLDALDAVFRQHGDSLACFIVEPWMGAGGAMPALPEFLNRARELTAKHGVLLILDEVISGFRFRAGNLGALYGIQPDLTTMGKIMGGGMPVAAVAGRADIMNLCGREGGRRVRFDGGTYCAHPLSMLAGRLMVHYLTEHEQEVYGGLGNMGARMREIIRRAFADEGILVWVGGDPVPAIPGSSVASVNFPLRADAPCDSPDAVNNPALYDVALRDRLAKVAFMLEGIHTQMGFGALSTAHGEEELKKVDQACRAVARRFKKAGLGLPIQ